jgi:prenyl protein peptidase
MLLVMILFAGPLFEQGVVEGAIGDWVKLRGVHESLSSWIGYRNYIVVCLNLRDLSLVLTSIGSR